MEEGRNIKTSRIIYPSCSELITYLPITDLEEIKETLRTIERITGWKVGILNEELVPSNTPLYRKRPWVFEYNFYKVNINDITIEDDEIGINRNLIPKEAYKCIPFYVRNTQLISLQLFNKHTGAYLDISLNDYYCDRFGLTLRAEQHCITRDFPAIAAILEHFKNIWHTHDGGSPNDFIEWCKQNNKDHLLDQMQYI